jgi:hypothetical protein
MEYDQRAGWVAATHWRKVTTLATALVERGEMTGDQVNEVLAGVWFF